MSTEFSNPFEAGVAVQLADMTELPAFEDVIAQVVDPQMTALQATHWAARISLKNLVRPAKFNGSIFNVELSPLDEPFEKLRNIQQDGWTLTKGSRPPGSTTEHDAAFRAERCLGFHLTADAKSSGRGIVGQIQVGLWYLPVPRFYNGTSLSNIRKTVAVKASLEW